MKKEILFISLLALFNSVAFAQNKNNDDNTEFTKIFLEDKGSFVSTGKNSYFILEPGFQIILQGMDEKDSVKLVITVLNETKKISGVETRVVEENESVNGKTVEISRNYFAFNKQTGSVFYFGEDVDIYKNGKVVNHSGAWLAEGNNKAGIAMPGMILLGAKYYQEIAPGVALDRAEIISMTEVLNTPAGVFTNCLKIEETTALDTKEKEYKLYAPGIGLIKDKNMLLVKFGFIK